MHTTALISHRHRHDFRRWCTSALSDLCPQLAHDMGSHKLGNAQCIRVDLDFCSEHGSGVGIAHAQLMFHGHFETKSEVDAAATAATRTHSSLLGVQTSTFGRRAESWDSGTGSAASLTDSTKGDGRAMPDGIRDSPGDTEPSAV